MTESGPVDQDDGARDRPDLYDLARRVGRLVPSWGDPGKFYDLRDEIAHDLHRLARQSPETQARACAPSPRERRLAALARAQAAENARLQRLLAQACQPAPRRRRVLDDRQLMLAL